MRRYKVNGVELACVESGTGEPLVLMHGANADRSQFDVFRPLLGPGIRAIAYDQRDSPDSPCDPIDYTVEDHARDAAELIAALGFERAHVMGTSYGGIVAMTLAVHHPQCVKSLVLGATAPAVSLIVAPDLTAVRSQGAEAMERFMLGTVVSPDVIDTDAVLVAETRAALRIRSQESFARRMAAVAKHDLRDRLSEIQVPTLILHGDEDPIVHTNSATLMAERIPGAELQLLHGSRHGITFQHRQRTADLVRSFVLSHA